MNKQTVRLLEQHFDTAFAVPDGIARLRELILTLAMQGRLVEQDPSDPPASELLKEIKAEKQRLVKAGKIKKLKNLPAFETKDAPYDLPQGWTWTYVGAIGNIFNGNSINAREKETKYTGVSGLPYIATKDVGYGLDELDYKNGIYIPESEKKFKIAHQGAVLICTEGGSAGKKCGITQKDICFGNKLFANELFCGIPSKFILYLYLSSMFTKVFKTAMTGIIGGVSITKFQRLPVPLPPLKEQNHIVAKIDKLMARCGKLEKLRMKREEKRVAVHVSSIKQLLDATDSSAWDFIQLHFNDFYTVKKNVAELRKTIFQLAVMGRLIPQNPDDPPARELLKEIKAEKQRLVRAKKIKKSKPISTISENGKPFPVPDNWRWVRIAELAESIDYGTSQKTCDDTSLVPVYRMGNIVDGQLIEERFKYISPDIEELPRLFLQPNDILFNRTNSYELVGKTALYTGPANHATFASYLIRIRLLDALMNPLFISQAMNAPYFRLTQIEPEIVQQCGQANFNGTKLSLCAVPLPPLPEQHRIVTRIDQLMALCDTMEQQIDAATSKQTEMLNAVMAGVGG
jgi:type I restriction enzyme, S subunit